MAQNAGKNGNPAEVAASVIALQHRQLETLNEIVTIALNGAHALATRQSEAASELHRHMAAVMSQPVTPSSVQDGVASSTDFAKRAFETGISHCIALTEIAAKIETDTLNILSKSVSDGLDGIGGALQKLSTIKR